MKITNLKKKTDNGYTFSLSFGPFTHHGFWYNSTANNVVVPARYTGDKRYPLVTGPGAMFKRLRDLVAIMAAKGIESYNSESDFGLGLAAVPDEAEALATDAEVLS